MLRKSHNNELPLPPLPLPGGHTQELATYSEEYRHKSTRERRVATAATCVGNGERETCSRRQQLIRRRIHQYWSRPLACGPLPPHYYRDVSGPAGDESQVDNKSGLLLPHASPSASSTTHMIRPISCEDNAHYRCKVSPHLLRFPAIDLTWRQQRPQSSPARPATHSQTQIGRAYMVFCLCSCRASCWHWLACDVQVHSTLAQTVVRIITRTREARFEGPTLKLFLFYSSSRRARRTLLGMEQGKARRKGRRTTSASSHTRSG